MMWDFVLSALRAAIPAGTPLLLAALGEVYAERSGVLNLGVEGMMIVGAVTGFGVAHATGNVWLGFAAAPLAGGAVALSHAFFSVTLRVNQVVSGIGHTMLGLGLSGLIGQRYVGLPLGTHMPPLAGLLVGGDAIQVSLGLPAATTEIFNGVILLLVVGSEMMTH